MRARHSHGGGMVHRQALHVGVAPARRHGHRTHYAAAAPIQAAGHQGGHLAAVKCFAVHIKCPCACRVLRSVQISENVICIQVFCCNMTGNESALTKAAVMQVACILLPLCFAYDIFWVFITPLMMGGKSVMVEVRPLTIKPWPLVLIQIGL